jgi:hypothetical protein
MIHRLRYFSDFHQTGNSEVLALLHQTKHLDKLREVDPLRSLQLMLLEERDNHIPKIRKPRHFKPAHFLPVIVTPLVYGHLSHPKKRPRSSNTSRLEAD